MEFSGKSDRLLYLVTQCCRICVPWTYNLEFFSVTFHRHIITGRDSATTAPSSPWLYEFSIKVRFSGRGAGPRRWCGR